MDLIFFKIGVWILIFLGGVHFLGTFVDLFRPFLFSPKDPKFKNQMKKHTALITNQTDFWKSWLGFNLSHGLGILTVGILLLYLANGPGVLESLKWIRPLAAFFSFVLLIMALKFWFLSPAIGFGMSFTAFVLSMVL